MKCDKCGKEITDIPVTMYHKGRSLNYCSIKCYLEGGQSDEINKKKLEEFNSGARVDTS